MLCRFTRIQHLHGCSSRLSYSSDGKRRWTQLDKKKGRKKLHFRSQHFTDPDVRKQEFRDKMRYCLEDVKTNALELPPIQHDGVMSVTPTNPLTKLLLQGSDKLRNQLLSPESGKVLSDEKLTLHLVKQLALFYEHHGRFEIPESGFDSYTTEQLQSFIERPTELLFAMSIQAKRNTRFRKKGSRSVEKSQTTSLNARKDIIPFYDLRSCYKKMAYWRLLRSKHEVNPVIFDMNFDDYMSKSCFTDLVMQLEYSMSFNIQQHDPMPFLFTNMKSDSFVYRSLSERRVHGFPNGFSTVTGNNLLQLDGINREDLVYLTPDAVDTLDVYDETKVYVIGGLVDARHAKEAGNATYKLAKQIGVARAKFPLKDYLIWGNATGRDELTLDAAYKVFHTFRVTGNWVQAFRHIPKRFYRGLTKFGKEQAKGDTELLDWHDSIIPRQDVPGKPKRQNSSDYLAWS